MYSTSHLKVLGGSFADHPNGWERWPGWSMLMGIKYSYGLQSNQQPLLMALRCACSWVASSVTTQTTQGYRSMVATTPASAKPVGWCCNSPDVSRSLGHHRTTFQPGVVPAAPSAFSLTTLTFIQIESRRASAGRLAWLRRGEAGRDRRGAWSTPGCPAVPWY